MDFAYPKSAKRELRIGTMIVGDPNVSNRVTISQVAEVDPVAHRLRMSIRMPFGMINDETVTMAPLGPDRCRISFG